MPRRGALVSQVLEGFSGDLLDQYPAVVRAYAQGQPGVYALYKGKRLYYVGLASDLGRRLTRHLVDRHRGKWDLFSLYLVRNGQHVKDLEALLLRIAHPRGNAQGGRFVQYEDLRRRVLGEVRRELQRRLVGLAPRAEALLTRRTTRGRRRRDDAPVLAPYLHRLTRLRLQATHAGRVHRARVLRSGAISVAGGRFASPSTAASRVLGRPCNGWTFWRFERGQDNWRPLHELRR